MEGHPGCRRFNDEGSQMLSEPPNCSDNLKVIRNASENLKSTNQVEQQQLSQKFKRIRQAAWSGANQLILLASELTLPPFFVQKLIQINRTLIIRVQRDRAAIIIECFFPKRYFRFSAYRTEFSSLFLQCDDSTSNQIKREDWSARQQFCFVLFCLPSRLIHHFFLLLSLDCWNSVLATTKQPWLQLHLRRSLSGKQACLYEEL